jgi:hypothetical protein
MATNQFQAMWITPGDVLMASSANAAAANNVTLATEGRLLWLAGFAVTGGGATAGSIIQVTTTGLAVNLAFSLVIPGTATTSIQPLMVTFWPALQASAPSQNITINVPSFGAGNTNASVSVWGYLT